MARALTMACALLVLGFAVSQSAWCAGPLPDPTQPPAAADTRGVSADGKPLPASYTVQAIVFSPERRLATVNGQQVHEGTRLGEARVVAIRRDSVTLQIAGRRQTVAIRPDVNVEFALNHRKPATTGAKVSPP